MPRLPIRPSAVLNTLYRTGSTHCLCRHHQDMVAIASECQHWAKCCSGAVIEVHFSCCAKRSWESCCMPCN